MDVSRYIRQHFRHFNAAELTRAAEGYLAHIERDGKMLLALGGAMSTAEIGVSLAEMIRQDKVHAISCTGANLEEDLFNLVAHEAYEGIPDFKHLSREDDKELFARDMNRVTDVCLPTRIVWERIERPIMDEWRHADKAGMRLFPHEAIFNILRSGKLEEHYEIDPNDSWVLAAAKNEIPIFVPGWEDSSLGNMFAAACIRGDVGNVHTIRNGIEVMVSLADWYEKTASSNIVGFFQIGGGISGDFAICVVPLLREDLERHELPKWSYFCQISDSTTSYGSYSGAPPNEKISWGKLDVSTPAFMIESDATIVAPLIFAVVLGW